MELLTREACETTLSSGANGKEVEGLAYLVQSLGAREVVASILPLAGSSVPALMEEFYGLGFLQPRASAMTSLNQAARTLLRQKKTRHPFYWAGYILVGSAGMRTVTNGARK